jgi:hypothetical protein
LAATAIFFSTSARAPMDRSCRNKPSVSAKLAIWLSRYGQSIYATRGGPYLPGDFGVSTYHDRTIYLHILHPTGTTLSLPALPTKILSCSSLTGGSADCKQANDFVEITLNRNTDAVDTIVALTLASPAAKIEQITTPVTGKNNIDASQLTRTDHALIEEPLVRVRVDPR